MSGVRVPGQKRGQASWEHLLAVSEELIAEVGFTNVTAAEISRRSGLSNGAIFWRVSSMEALFVAVHEHFVERLDVEQRVLEDPGLWADLDLEEFVAAAVRFQADLYVRHGRMFAALTARVSTDQGTAARAGKAVRGGGAKFVGHVAPHLAAHGCHEPEVVASSLFQIVNGALLSRVTWPEQLTALEISWDRLVDDLGQMCGAYATRHAGGQPSITRPPSGSTS